MLVVEDDAANLLIARTALEASGIEVDGAGSAEEAREIVVRRRPDLVLMDIQLPGISGLEFTRELKSDQKTSEIPVFALTAHGMPLYARAASAAGCVGFIAKPTSPALLRAQVEDFLAAVPGRTG